MPITQTLRAFVQLQLTSICRSLPGCASASAVDNPDEATEDIEKHLARMPPVARTGARLALSDLDFAALQHFQKRFHELNEADQRVALSEVEKLPFGKDVVSLLARITWLVIYSRDGARNAIGFDLPSHETISVPPPATPADLSRVYDLCIVGSGAGGSVVAALIAETGKYDVLIVEEGQWVDPALYPTRDDKALTDLYRDAGVQPAWPNPAIPTAGGTFMTVLQGCVVGGGPAVNNAIHLPLEHWAWQEWAALGFPLTWEQVSNSTDQVARDLSVAPIDRPLLGERSLTFADGAGKLGLNVEDLRLSVHECLQCGGCNVGCRFGRKIGGLHGALPGEKPATAVRSYLMRALEAGAKLRPRLRALSLEHGFGDGHVTSLLCQDLENNGSKVQVKARKYVLAAGSMASSKLLLDSGVDAGRQFSANVVTSVFGRMPRDYPPGPSNPGIQMCLWVREHGPEYLLETWFHYPGSLAGTLPGWVEDHSAVMTQYKRLAGCGVVIPTDNHGRLNGRDLILGLDGGEFARMKAGILEVADAFIKAGATEVYPCTTKPFTFHSGEQLPRDKEAYQAQVRGPADLTLATSHLQGGNPMARTRQNGVVGSDFKQFDLDNVFVADASLFPAGVHRNPQMTVMALARLAAEQVIKALAG